MNDSLEFTQQTIEEAIHARLSEISAQANKVGKRSTISAQSDTVDPTAVSKKIFAWWMPVLALIACIVIGGAFYYWDAYRYTHEKLRNDMAISQVMQDWIGSLNDKNYHDFFSLSCSALRNSSGFENPLTFEKEITQGKRKFGRINFIKVNNLFIQAHQAQASLIVNYPQFQAHNKRIIEIRLEQELDQWKSCSITPRYIFSP